MRRVVVLGPGAAGKSTFARRLAARSGLPLVELDRLFWDAELRPTPPGEWSRLQAAAVSEPTWILEGDLGPYDVLEPWLRAADTIVLVDLPLWRCAWRALRRSRERLDFWRWLVTWRRRYRPGIVDAIRAVRSGGGGVPAQDAVSTRGRGASSVRWRAVLCRV